MTVSIHATLGKALVISPHQSKPLPTQPKRKREGGGVTAFPPSLPPSVTLFPCLPAHLCLSVKLKLFFCECCASSSRPHTTCDFRPRFNLLRPCVRFAPVGERQVSLIFLCVAPSLSSVCLSLPPLLSSVCMQTRPRR